ncbi:MAG: YbaK/EbsC family protein [Candidatus Microsaccharimonas sp.]
MKFGKLTFTKAYEKPELLPTVVLDAIKANNLDASVSEINPNFSDTAAFCEAYDISPDESANCVIIEAKRGDKIWYAACMVLATKRADVNGVIRKYLDARKTSFAPMDVAVNLTGMEYGGINPIGLPADWPIIVDTRVKELDDVLIGSGLRKSKLLVSGNTLASLPNAVVLDIVKETV